MRHRCDSVAHADHSQCNTPACWERETAPVAAQVPVVTGEVGCGAGFVNGYLDWADTRGGSVIGWTWTVFDCWKGQVAMITDYAGTPTMRAPPCATASAAPVRVYADGAVVTSASAETLLR